MSEKPYSFTVDTHIFRELGELLVGRDSTALVELLKNAYDADASKVVVHGANLSSPEQGEITITDDGNGMTSSIFRDGFLRIASRIKEAGSRRSARFDRRFTGAKGVGRLAAHKLARRLEVTSIPRRDVHRNAAGIEGYVDWDVIEKQEVLDTVSSGFEFNSFRSAGSRGGTTIKLTNLRRAWTETERARFFWEVQSFRPPEILIRLPDEVLTCKPLFQVPIICDAGSSDPGFEVCLTGEFESGDEYWTTLIENVDWIIEIKAEASRKKIHYKISPTANAKAESAESSSYTFDLGSEDPSFYARIFIREGVSNVKKDRKQWLGRMHGVRIYHEGFRVLPYGEPGNDWLQLDFDSTRRARTLQFLDGEASEGTDKDEGLSLLPNRQYFGAVFLTTQGASELKMLVNREGYIPDRYFDALFRRVRAGVDLSTRIRAANNAPRREEWREKRATASPEAKKQTLERAVGSAAQLAKEARSAVATGDVQKAATLIEQAAQAIDTLEDLKEHEILHILAAIGLQMAAFVHEVVGLLGVAQAIESSIETIRKTAILSPRDKTRLAEFSQGVAEMRRTIERQASYLTDVASVDSRRRRARQNLHERFDAAAQMFEVAAENRGITIHNNIPTDLQTKPMFAAEMTLIFSNLISNAMKAAGKDGEILASARLTDSVLVTQIENTGIGVDLNQSERWFRPFESTTENPDPALGQGMGMGLPITRNMIEDYGGTINFVKPSRKYSTAIEFRLPSQK